MMKKNFLLMVCLVVMGMLSVNAQTGIGTVALHHAGKVTIYYGGRIQEAVDASVKGDTLYLSEGVFEGFDVPHGIVVLGSGVNTVIPNNITIKGNAENKDLGDYVFSGLNLLKDFVVNDSVHGFKMHQCQMQNFKVNSGKYMDEAEITMSYIKTALTLQTSVRGLTVINSKIYDVYGGGNVSGAVSFYQCNVYRNSYSTSTGNTSSSSTYAKNNVYLNSIVYYASYATFVNCLYFSYSYSPVLYNSYSGSFSFSSSMNCSLSDETLKSKGYLGNDSTVVGITGGALPYTLELFTPHVVEHKLDVDNANRTLKVTLKMAGEATKNEE